MNRWAGRSGATLISWAQTAIDGDATAGPEALSTASTWRWQGQAVDLDPAETFLPEGAFSDAEAHRRHSVSVACRVIGRALGYALTGIDANRVFSITDGHRVWVATLIDLPGRDQPVLMFSAGLPPAGLSLFVARVDIAATLVSAQPAGVVCFTPGTRIGTPGGLRPVEHLAAGDRVMTADAGAREIVWIGARYIGMQELGDAPDLAPVRLRQGALETEGSDGDLIVSPDHAMLVRGRDGDSEVLVSARDLVDGKRVLREPAAQPITYIHLMLESHHLLVANGFETESFHPASARLDAVPERERLRLYDVMPDLRGGAEMYGPPVRPMVSGAEAALIAAA
ncbi:MAG: Hint domain-containing protein [Boseongicola sp.]|nr:Hint domain-containing protein [Boseongicola sp.]